MLPLLLLAGCAKDIKTLPPPAGQTVVVFDPSSTPPQIPIPTDLAMNQATGLLAVPVADATAQPAQADFDTFLNTLNGYPPTSTAEVHFAGELDESTISDKTVLVFESDPANPTQVAPVTGLTLQYKALESGSMLRIWNYAGWKNGMRYLFFVMGGANGVKDKQGQPVIRSALFELAAAESPLCAWDATKSWDATSMSCTEPGVGGTATGCCTFNYSALIESSVKSALRADPGEMSEEELELLIKKTVLKTATDFETLRRSYEQILGLAAAAKINRDDVAVLWSFKVVDMNQAVFNPSANPPAIPTPTDLIRDPSTGLLQVPTAAGASKAEAAFNAYLSTLNGYPTGSTGVLSFTGDLDKDSAANGIRVYELDKSTTPPTMAAATDINITYDETNRRVVITRSGGFNRAKSYVLLALGNDQGLKNKDTALGDYPKRTALMHLVLSENELCKDYDAATATCKGDPLISSFIDDPADKPGALTGVQKASSFETIRRGYDQLVQLITAADTTVKRDEIKALWSFSVTSQTEVLFDPSTSRIPFPNDVLIDQTTGKVNIPAGANETPAEQALREGLNTLDGFSTMGRTFAEVTGKLKEDSLTATSALAINTTTSFPVPMTFELDNTAGAIVGQPTSPFDEKTRYAVVLISKPKAGSTEVDEGLADDKGRYLVPSSFFVLARSEDPVYDETTKKSLVSTVDDATAAQIETLRQAYKPLFDGLATLNIKRTDIVAAWTYTTQTITEPLTQLRALPWQIFGQVDSNQPQLSGTLDTTLTGWPSGVPSSALGGWVPNGSFKTWIALDEQGTAAFKTDPTQGTARDVPFMLTIPSGTMPTGGWPVVMFQHGLGKAKSAMVAVANTLAQAGYATIAFDIIYHGDRTWCTKDEDCDGTGTCTVADGTCSTQLADSDGDGNPDASGGDRFLNSKNPFAIRDNMRQHVIDAAALLRAIALGGASGITGGTVAFNPTQVNYVGESLGSILGTLVLATDSLPKRAVLAVPGGKVVDIFLGPESSPAFTSTKTRVLTEQGIAEGSLEYIRLLATFQWIVDPADPGNFARYVKTDQLDDLVNAGNKVPQKEVLVQLAELDNVVPIQYGQYLAKAMGADVTKSTFDGQDHGVLLKASPDATATAAAQTQMATFLTSGNVCTPEFTSGSYTGSCN